MKEQELWVIDRFINSRWFRGEFQLKIRWEDQIQEQDDWRITMRSWQNQQLGGKNCTSTRCGEMENDLTEYRNIRNLESKWPLWPARLHFVRCRIGRDNRSNPKRIDGDSRSLGVGYKSKHSNE